MKKPRNRKAAEGREGSETAAPPRPASPAAASGRPRWPWYAAVAIVLLMAGFQAYGPALGGEFVFDDSYLPFADPVLGDMGLSAWTGVRPVLMFSFWINHRFFNNDPFWLHVFNVLLHFLNAGLVFLITRRLLGRAGDHTGNRDLLAAGAAGVFLLHPIQTESIAYIASRSEALSVLFLYAALAVFLYRREDAISFREAVVILALFGAAVLTKEHTAVLPVLLVLTDVSFGEGSVFASLRRTWRLYLPIAFLGIAGAASVWQVLRASDSAGFNVKDFTWYQYLFTQCRVIWMYVRMVVLPYGQNVDPDIAVSRTIIDHGALIGFVALVAVAVWAWVARRRFPLASYGALASFVLLGPTSSFVPIQDVAAERRVYMPLLGLLLIGVDFLRRVRVSRGTLAAALSAVVVILAVLTWQRNHVWANAIALWSDSAAKSPRKVRPRFQLAFAYYSAGRCADAVREYGVAARLQPPDYRLLVDWALAYDCDNEPELALARLREAIALEPTSHAYSLVGMVEGKRGKNAEALRALATALEMDSRNDAALAYRGNIRATSGELEQAAADYRLALSINPRNQVATRGLLSLEGPSKRKAP